MGRADEVVIDCDTCSVRGAACGDCVVTLMLGPPGRVGVPDEERRALELLARHGLVPALRMETAAPGAARPGAPAAGVSGADPHPAHRATG